MLFGVLGVVVCLGGVGGFVLGISDIWFIIIVIISHKVIFVCFFVFLDVVFSKS